jgi:hypothetical protein
MSRNHSCESCQDLQQWPHVRATVLERATGKWSVDGQEDLRGLAAFRRAYPSGESFVVAANIRRPLTRRLAALTVDYVALDDLATKLGLL